MELPDIFGLVAPRYATQLLSMIGAIVLLVTIILLAATRLMTQAGFWFGIIFLSLLSFGLAFLVGGDSVMFGSFRADQFLDLLTAVIGVIGLATSLVRPPLHESLVDEVRTFHKEVE